MVGAPPYIFFNVKLFFNLDTCTKSFMTYKFVSFSWATAFVSQAYVSPKHMKFHDMCDRFTRTYVTENCKDSLDIIVFNKQNKPREYNLHVQ